MKLNFKNYNMIILLAITAIIISISFVATYTEEHNNENKDITVQNNEDEEEKVPDPFVGLLIGLDKSRGLTDVIMVGYMDTVNNEVKVISIPRDLVIDFRDEEFKHIKENNPKNRILYSKLNEVYYLSGWDNRALEDVREIASVITGLEIDYMTCIDVDGFKDVVDIIGGVDFYVPEDMYHSDPAQDLYINLKEGFQHLDGDKAEQLVRYRDYTMGDLQRIQVQQDFMVALVEKMMGISSLDQITKLVQAAYNMFEADFGLMFVLEYAEYFYNLEVKDILKSENMITINSYGDKVDNIWYQRWDKDLAHEEVENLIYNNNDSESDLNDEEDELDTESNDEINH